MYLLRIFCDEVKREQILKDSPKPRIWLNHPAKHRKSCGFGGAAWFGYHVVQEPVSTFNVVAGIAVMFFGLTLKAWATYQLKHR